MEPIKISVVSDVTTDIIIPFHGEYNSVVVLLKSLQKINGRYKITLIDDCSPNTSFSNSFNKTNITCVRSNERIGFAGAVNLGISLTSNPLISVLHSDCVITQAYWLRYLLSTLESNLNSKVVMVSGKSNNPGEGMDDLLKSDEDKINEEEDDCFIDGVVPVFNCIFYRKLIEKIGLLKVYGLGFYEDEEFCHRIRKNGYKIALSSQCWLYHEGGKTFKNLNNKKLQKMIDENREKCVEDINIK